MTMDFSGKQVVVTGGTGALGSAVVGALLAGGASCIPMYMTPRRSVFPIAAIRT
jgi:NAD(P)-dependent dehydrogenase (short-subunit alcohol dehydrogenase family)